MPANQFSTSTEREALCGFLDKQRADLLRKVEGVSDTDARSTPTVSSLSLMGLLKHWRPRCSPRRRHRIANATWVLERRDRGWLVAAYHNSPANAG